MRNIPAALQAHLNQPDTTTTRLIKITLSNESVYGLTTLDADVDYDDGDGEITYVSTNGFDPSTLSSDIGYSVDNAEGYALISEDIPGITEQMAEAGDLDDAQWVCYIVNYEDLSMGHAILDGGDLGEVRTRYGMVWIPELLSYAMRLRQPIGSVFSRRCRAIFGTPADSQTGCGIDLAPLWVNGEVLSVGAETDRIFTGDATTDTGQPIAPVPGRVEWLTGANAGREYSVEDLDSGDTVTLNETTPYPIEVGDTYRIRPDCLKRYLEDCIGVWDNGINFKGEPLTPVGDGVAIQTPGAQLVGGGGFVGQVPPAVGPTPPEPDPTGPITWTYLGAIAGSEDFFDVAFGANIFVGVAREGHIWSSPNGETWTQRRTGDGTYLLRVRFVNGIFIAAGWSGLLLTSPDGITWTTQTTGSTRDLESAAYGAGAYVVAASGGKVLRSTDSISWTELSSGVSNFLHGATYGDGLFVVTGNSGVIRTSPDGITWTGRTSSTTNSITDVIYEATVDMFVATTQLGSSGNKIRYSSDGITWNPGGIASSAFMLMTTYGNVRFMCVGLGGTSDHVLWASLDGITWASEGVLGDALGLNCITFGNSRFVALGGQGNVCIGVL